MSERVYRWTLDCGRMGDLSGLFVAKTEEVESALHEEACFGEALGKHSDVSCTLEADQFEVLSAHPEVVKFVQEHGPFGRNPLGYVVYHCAMCGSRIHPDEVVYTHCKTCEHYFCTTNCVEAAGGHADHDIVEVDE